MPQCPDGLSAQVPKCPKGTQALRHLGTRDTRGTLFSRLLVGRVLFVKTSLIEVTEIDIKNNGNVLCDQEEVLDIFVDLDDDLSVCKDAYLTLVAR